MYMLVDKMDLMVVDWMEAAVVTRQVEAVEQVMCELAV
jgi:hypothetical protein